MRDIWLEEDDLQEAGIYHPEPFIDALIPYFPLDAVSAEQFLDYCDWRAAYLARYARVSPIDLEQMDPERVDRLLVKVSELVLQEYKARAGTSPLTPPTEDDAG